MARKLKSDRVLFISTLLLVGVLAITGVLLALDTYHAVPTGFTAEVDLVRQLHRVLDESRIATALRDTLVPLVQSLLGPLLPPDVRSFG